MDWSALISSVAAFTKALAWPAVALIGLYWYKPTVSRLLDRVVKGKIGPNGAEVEALAPNQISVESPQAEITEQVGRVEGGKNLPPKDAFFDSIGGPIIATLEKDFPDDVIGQKAWLTRLLAINIAYRTHEETHRMIFGSQLLLLYKLNSAGGTLPNEQTLPLYHQAVTNFPDVYSGFDFGLWVNFLIVRGVVERAEYRGQPALSLTKAGRSYLQYIIDRQLPEKPIG